MWPLLMPIRGLGSAAFLPNSERVFRDDRFAAGTSSLDHFESRARPEGRESYMTRPALTGCSCCRVVCDRNEACVFVSDRSVVTKSELSPHFRFLQKPQDSCGFSRPLARDKILGEETDDVVMSAMLARFGQAAQPCRWIRAQRQHRSLWHLRRVYVN